MTRFRLGPHDRNQTRKAATRQMAAKKFGRVCRKESRTQMIAALALSFALARPRSPKAPGHKKSPAAVPRGKGTGRLHVWET